MVVMSKSGPKIYTINGETFISNMDMSEEELKEQAKLFYEIYDKPKGIKPFKKKLPKNRYDAIRYLEKEIEEEKNRLIGLGILKKSNIGHLSSIYEGEEYINDLYELMILYIGINGFKRAINIGEEILRLDPEYMPHLHAIVVSLYACLEDDQRINKVCKSCNRPCMIYFISMMSVYYKKGNFNKAKEYLDLINRTNSCFIPYFKGKKVNGEEADVVLNIVKDFDYLFHCTPYIDEFIKKDGNV